MGNQEINVIIIEILPGSMDSFLNEILIEYLVSIY